MNSGKIKAVLFIIVFLLITAVVASWFVSRDPAEAPVEPVAPIESVAVDDTPVVVTPEPTAVLITPVPKVTPSQPAPTPQPTPTPAPTPVPTPVPTPEPVYGETLGSGSFSSQYGIGMDLVTDWSVTTLNANEVSVAVTVRLYSGAVYSVPVPLGINVGGQYVTLTAAAVDYSDAAMAYHTLGSQTFTVSAPSGQTTSIPVEASWHFDGTYGGTDVPALECGSFINVTRN